VHLDGPIDDPVQRVGHEVLRHRHLGAKVGARVDPVGGVQHHQLRLVELHGGVGDHPLDALLLRQIGAVGEALRRPVHHHVERRLGLAEPAHAVGETRRTEARLAEQVALTAAAEHAVGGNTQVADADLAVVVSAGHRLDVAHQLPARRRKVDQERAVRRLGDLGLVLGTRDRDREAGAAHPRDEPLVPVDHPHLTLEHGAGLDQRRVGARDLGFGHREARVHPPLAQRTQVGFLLLVGRPVEQRVHVALVGCLGVEREGTEARLRRLGGHGRHRDVAEAHAPVLRGHLGQPQPPLVGGLAHPEDPGEQRVAVLLVDLLLRRSHHRVDELAHAQTQGLELGGKAEIDRHRSSGMLSEGAILASRPLARRLCTGRDMLPPCRRPVTARENGAKGNAAALMPTTGTALP
jgi:hypothetical protein